MIHEKIIIREDGTKFKISVELSTSLYDRKNVQWRVTVHRCFPKKRTWLHVLNNDDYRYRRLSPEERVEYIKSLYLEHVTAEEVLEAKMELWAKIKPTQ